MTIRVNGDPVELPAELTILQLLEQLHIDPRLVAVEHNLTIIKRARYESTPIAEGDQIEIVNFVGGGSGLGARGSGLGKDGGLQTQLAARMALVASNDHRHSRVPSPEPRASSPECEHAAKNHDF